MFAAIPLLIFPLIANASSWQPESITPPPPPAVSAKAAYVYDASSQTPLFALNEDEPLAPGSLTKIVTALVVIDHAKLDDVIEITPDDVVSDDESRVGLVAGDRMSVDNLLHGLLIPSGNDAALALARHVGKSLENGTTDPVAAFVAEMNRYDHELGFTGTTFENPAGLDGETHLATAHDLALLAARALADPVLGPIMGIDTMTLPSEVLPDGYPIFTTNDLLVEGLVQGGKTGTTEKAGGCLMTWSNVDGNSVVTVVLGSTADVNAETGFLTSPARYDDTRLMLAALPETYAWIDPAAPDVTPGLGEEMAAWGVALDGGRTIPVVSSTIPVLDYRLELGPAAAPGEAAGRVLFLQEERLVATAPVVSAGAAASEAAFASGEATR